MGKPQNNHVRGVAQRLNELAHSSGNAEPFSLTPNKGLCGIGMSGTLALKATNAAKCRASEISLLQALELYLVLHMQQPVPCVFCCPLHFDATYMPQILVKGQWRFFGARISLQLCNAHHHLPTDQPVVPRLCLG